MAYNSLLQSDVWACIFNYVSRDVSQREFYRPTGGKKHLTLVHSVFDSVQKTYANRSSEPR